jgi:hypothetical protein
MRCDTNVLYPIQGSWLVESYAQGRRGVSASFPGSVYKTTQPATDASEVPVYPREREICGTRSGSEVVFLGCAAENEGMLFVYCFFLVFEC